MKILFRNIKELLQVREAGVELLRGSEMKELAGIKTARLLVEDGRIEHFGEMSTLPELEPEEVIDASGKMLLPSWVDSHPHLVYAGNREQEFVDRINGLTYEQIAEKGGGIVNSAKKLQETSEEDLYHQSAARLEEVMRLGTGAIEIKSGYGLTTDAELKMLRVAKKLSEEYPITIKTTFLGAHAIPTEYKGNKDGYLDLL